MNSRTLRDVAECRYTENELHFENVGNIKMRNTFGKAIINWSALETCKFQVISAFSLAFSSLRLLLNVEEGAERKDTQKCFFYG